LIAPSCTCSENALYLLFRGCQYLDSVIGCVRPGTVTELSGPAGSGKTQIALMFLLTAQLPVEQGGFGSRSLYLCSEDMPMRRCVSELLLCGLCDFTVSNCVLFSVKGESVRVAQYVMWCCSVQCTALLTTAFPYPRLFQLASSFQERPDMAGLVCPHFTPMPLHTYVEALRPQAYFFELCLCTWCYRTTAKTDPAVWSFGCGTTSWYSEQSTLLHRVGRVLTCGLL
jgi:Rad51 protein